MFLKMTGVHIALCLFAVSIADAAEPFARFGSGRRGCRPRRAV